MTLHEDRRQGALCLNINGFISIRMASLLYVGPEEQEVMANMCLLEM